MHITNIPKIMEIGNQYSNNSVICNVFCFVKRYRIQPLYILKSKKKVSSMCSSILKIENYS